MDMHEMVQPHVAPHDLPLAVVYMHGRSCVPRYGKSRAHNHQVGLALCRSGILMDANHSHAQQHRQNAVHLRVKSVNHSSVLEELLVAQEPLRQHLVVVAILAATRKIAVSRLFRQC